MSGMSAEMAVDIANAAAGLIDAGTNIYTSIWNKNATQENFEYQKALQQTIFEREDNAVQRRVADLEKAGLSKVLASGSSAGSGAVVSTTPPKLDYQANAQATLQNVIDVMTSVENLKVAEATEEKLKAETSNLEGTNTSIALKNVEQGILNEILSGKKSSMVELAKYQALQAFTDQLEKQHNLFYAQKMNIPTNHMPKSGLINFANELSNSAFSAYYAHGIQGLANSIDEFYNKLDK
ncbi:minor capsid protein [Capybara microvirus Cap3_SP_581]|nr:minor capsid protein [Capybara microvirus Cap3_SP_581]